ncbi:MAG TPA: MaoC family dehydratase [Chloroflexota bacterium]|nr:MaoC family dehydratase [Chloroflexota bacterium]
MSGISGIRFFDDFRVGETIELGTVTISEEEIIAFARQFDPQPFHTDPEAAARSRFGGLIASGWQTVGLFMRLYVERVLSKTVSLGSPGVDTIRWPHPVRPGDTLTGRWTVLECRPSRTKPDRGVIRSRGEILNQNGEIVLSLEALNIIGRAPEDP